MKPLPTKENLINSALHYLSYRPRSRKEVEQFLSKKTEDTDLINQIITELVTKKFIDDVQFAAWVVASRSRSRPRGARLLKQELQSKGVDPQIISENLITTTDEKELAYQALLKKNKLWSKLSAIDYHQKASRFLSSRGFPWSVIEEVVKKSYNDTHVN